MREVVEKEKDVVGDGIAGGGVAGVSRGTVMVGQKVNAYSVVRRAMLLWDVGHYVYEFLYWGSTFVAFFLSALWDESFRLQNGEVDEETQEAVRRRLSESTEYAAAEAAGDVEATDEFTPGELNSYSAIAVAIMLTLVIKYVIFPWLFVSFVPRLRNMSHETFALTLMCSLKAFGKLVKLSTDFILPLLLLDDAASAEELGRTSAVSSVGEYLGDWGFGPWLFLVYVLPMLRGLVVSPAAAKRSVEP